MYDSLTIEVFDAIRNSETLGRGSCSTIDECYSDTELKQQIFEYLVDNTYTDAKTAIAFYERIEAVHAERDAMCEW